MKTFFLCVVCGFCATSAVAQVGGAAMSAPTSSPFTVTGHVQHASQTALASTQNVMGNYTTMSAKGERPLWEFMPLPTEVPLGDVAREVRKQHEDAKKSAVVWINQ